MAGLIWTRGRREREARERKRKWAKDSDVKRNDRMVQVIEVKWRVRNKQSSIFTEII